MKKAMMASFVLVLLTNSTATAWADSSTIPSSNSKAQPVMSSGEQATPYKQLPSSFVVSRPLIAISRLNLSDVQSRAVTDSLNLALLRLKLHALESKRSDLKSQASSMSTSQTTDAYSLPDTPEKILGNANYQIPPDAAPEELYWLGPIIETNSVVNGLMSGVKEIINGMNDMLKSQRDELLITVKQLERDGWNTELDLEEAKEGIKLQVTGQYVQLLSLQEQMKLYEEGLQLLQKEQTRLQEIQSQGVAAPDDSRGLQLEISKQTRELDMQRTNYRLALLQLCFDLGIRYDPDIILEDVTMNDVALPNRKDPGDILARSYELKRKWNELRQASWEHSNTKTSTSYEKSYLSANVGAANTQSEQANVQLTKQIHATYAEAENAYQQFKNAQFEANHAATDVEALQHRIQLGVVPLYDLNQSIYQRQQADTKVKLLRLQYFVVLSKVEAMERGFIVGASPETAVAEQ
ncbi:TolC family protein [Paenibacillus guangzhouensis]|uniref:TolC family protein n=1 Tax=Paenibacillus guangzhouensis TaxID=1473112 RepID=UPI00187B1DE7|nr:TolC family protein [Paenibacillus guangzhouensis]